MATFEAASMRLARWRASLDLAQAGIFGPLALVPGLEAKGEGQKPEDQRHQNAQAACLSLRRRIVCGSRWFEMRSGLRTCQCDA